jgi:ABC-type transport system involved in Fe-S cluster assembly fused permease/ATPase subunit
MCTRACMQIYAPLNYFGSYYRQIQRYMIDMENMFELLGASSAVDDKPGAEEFELKGGEIAFRNVTFGYKPDRIVLRNISFPCALPPLRSISCCWPLTHTGDSAESR